jgi:hypothetical protein
MGAVAELAGLEALLGGEKNAGYGLAREHEKAVSQTHSDQAFRVAENQEELLLFGDGPILERAGAHGGEGTEAIALFKLGRKPRGTFLKGKIRHLLEIILLEEVVLGAGGTLEIRANRDNERENLVGRLQVMPQDEAFEGDFRYLDRPLPFRADVGNVKDASRFDESLGKPDKFVEAVEPGPRRIESQPRGKLTDIQNHGDGAGRFHESHVYPESARESSGVALPRPDIFIEFFRREHSKCPGGY